MECEDPYRRQAPSPGQLLLRPKLYHIYWTGRPTNFRIGTPVEHALSTVTPCYKAVKLGSCTRTGTYRVGRTQRLCSLFKDCIAVWLLYCRVSCLFLNLYRHSASKYLYRQSWYEEMYGWVRTTSRWTWLYRRYSVACSLTPASENIVSRSSTL